MGQIRQNLLYIYLSILSGVLPSPVLSRFNYEFPSLAGGAVGLCLSALMAKRQWVWSPTQTVKRKSPHYTHATNGYGLSCHI